MADLNALLKDIQDNRLAWLSIRREKEEAFFAGLVEEIEALKERSRVALESLLNPRGEAAVENVIAQAKRGPGRPPKVEEAA